MPEVSVNGTRLYYEDHGSPDRPAMVFGYSLFFDHTMFRHQVERFSSEYRVVVYDHRGQGRSAAAPVEELDMDTLAADAAALIEALELAPCHYIGNSMGGFIAARLAARRPDLLLSAVMMESSAEAEGKVKEFGPLVDHLQQHGTQDVIDPLMYIMFGDTTLSDQEREDLRKQWKRYMLELPTMIGDAAHGVVYRKDVLSELADARVPVLAIAGQEDHAYEANLSKNIVDTAPQGSWTTVDRAGHSLAVECPGAVNQQLVEHFASTTAQTSNPT